MRIAPLDSGTLSLWIELFESSHCRCYCRYWHFEGAKNDWLARCAFAEQESRAEQAASVAAGEACARGLLAIDDDAPRPRAIGWMKLAPRRALTKLTSLPVYRGVLEPEGVAYSVACFLVHPENRGRGVARELLRAADDFVRGWGGSCLEAYPRRTNEPMHAEEAWLGPEALFRSCGFIAVPGDGPYPVFRKSL